MKEALLGQWIQALRSGGYTQCQGILQYRDSYCCLGVLSVINGHVRSSGAIPYPDMPLYEEDYTDYRPGLLTDIEAQLVIPLNDTGPMDNYKRVLWLLESAPELFIS